MKSDSTVNDTAHLKERREGSGLQCVDICRTLGKMLPQLEIVLGGDGGLHGSDRLHTEPRPEGLRNVEGNVLFMKYSLAGEASSHMGI